MASTSLSGKTLFVTGASRGIGLAISLRAAAAGANVAIAAKTATPHATLEGTIYTAAEQIEAAGGKALPIVCDIRDEDAVNAAVEETVETFGGIDILINNASAIMLTGTLNTPMKRYDLMNQVNARGTYMTSQACLPHLLKSDNPHILNISPPLNMNPRWFANHVAYTMAKYGMSMCVLGMAEEFRDQGVAVNALWPRTAIWTAAMGMLGGDDAAAKCRNVNIMSDAAYHILTQNARECTGNFFIDDEVIKEAGITDLDQYAVVPGTTDFMPDFFLDPEDDAPAAASTSSAAASMAATASRAAQVLHAIGQASHGDSDLAGKFNAVVAFKVDTDPPSHHVLDMRNGQTVYSTEAPSSPDVMVTASDGHFTDLLDGKLDPAMAWVTGKIKIDGDVGLATKVGSLLKRKSKL